MFDDVMRGVEGLSVEELEEVIGRLQALVLEALEGPDCEPDTRPWCGGAHFVRKGFDKVFEGGVVIEKTQRYRCNVCGRTFTRRTLGLLAWSKLDARTWSDYVGLELQRTSIEDMAGRLGVNVSTVHFMRLRLAQVMRAATPRMECGFDEGSQVDGYYLSESMTGLGRRGGAEMPREAHRTSHDVRKRGISNLKVCVACGVADDGRQFAELCDRGRPTDQAVRGALEPRIGSGAVVSTTACRPTAASSSSWASRATRSSPRTGAAATACGASTRSTAASPTSCAPSTASAPATCSSTWTTSTSWRAWTVASATWSR